MFDLPNQALPLIERMRGQERSAQAAAITPDEVDLVVEQLFVPLFEKQGINITAVKSDDGSEWTVSIKR